MAELEVAGPIEHSRRDRSDLWKLTTKGRRLDAVRDEITLPESPQHRRWSEARIAVAERIAGFRGDLRRALEDAMSAPDAEHEADSATSFDLSERLNQTGRRLASAIHCMREPDDSHPDSDDDAPYRQRARRQVREWSTPF